MTADNQLTNRRRLSDGTGDDYEPHFFLPKGTEYKPDDRVDGPVTTPKPPFRFPWNTFLTVAGILAGVGIAVWATYVAVVAGRIEGVKTDIRHLQDTDAEVDTKLGEHETELTDLRKDVNQLQAATSTKATK